jgi:tRNA A37 threonylcarbamoyladenosine dehydratase
MMDEWQQRTQLLLGDEVIRCLSQLHVLVVGVGGVGGYVVEALARAGVGRISMIDMDVVATSNRNRQLVALVDTVGQTKVSVMAQRVMAINPLCNVEVYTEMLCQDASERLLVIKPDVIVDAIDSLNCKVALLLAAVHVGLTIYSSMGAGRRLDVSKVRMMDIMDTSGCGLARQVRTRLRKAGVGRGITCVSSTETPRDPGPLEAAGDGRERVVNGTISYMPAIFGLMLAGTLLKDQVQRFEMGASATQ